MGSRSANLLINSCSLCGLCEAVCPEDFAMQDLCLQARRSMVQRGKMPPSAHEFALEDMAFSLGEDFFLARHVTFWVEYAPCEAGFEVFNAYAHRMEVHGP